MGYVRWDPTSRAGAVAVKTRRAVDAEAIQDVSDAVSDWARYQNLAGEVDTVETSTISGTYNWQSYIQEETTLARRRDEDRIKAREKKPAHAPAPPPAPLHLYN